MKWIQALVVVFILVAMVPSGIALEQTIDLVQINEPIELTTLENSLNVPLYSQSDSRWGDDLLGTGLVTIRNYGCALTSVAMVISFFSEDIYPRTLNQWLISNHGYSDNDQMIWWKAAEYDNNVMWVENKNYYYYDEDENLIKTPADLIKIKEELAAGNPVIAEVRNSGYKHFVVITGYSGDTFYVNDPADGTQRTLDASRYDTGDDDTPENRIYAIRIYHPSTSNTVTIPNPISPGLSLPPGEHISTLIPIFSWENLPGADGYRLYVSECDENGKITESRVFVEPQLEEPESTPISGNSYSNIPAGTLESGKYYVWNIEPMVDGTWGSQYSALRYFYTSSSSTKLNTDAATGITSTSAVLHGHLVNGAEGTTYPVCFRYEGGNTPKTKTLATTVSSGNPDYEFQLTGLEPETIYYYRAVHSESTGTENPNPIDAESTQSFTTSSGTSSSGSIQVSTTPADASVYLDTAYMGRSPVTIPDIAVGTHTVRVTKSGYQEQTRSVTVTADQTSVVSVSLPLINPSGRTYTVGPSGCDFTRIQDAVYGADDWDRIEVISGIYYENVIVNKSLIIQGRDTGGGKPIIDGQWFDTVVKIIADNVTFSNFKVINSASSTDYNAGIYILSHNVNINNCAFNDNGYGVYIPKNYGGIFISSSTFEYNSAGGIFSESGNHTIVDVSIGYSSNGIQVGSNNFMQNVNINNCHTGLIFESNNTIINSDIQDNSYQGISGGSNNKLEGLNVVYNQYKGIGLSDGNTLNNVNANENANTDYYYWSDFYRVSIGDNNTLNDVTATSQDGNPYYINIGSHNRLFNIAGPIQGREISQNNTIRNLIGDLGLTGPYNTIRNVSGSVGASSNFNDIIGIYGELVIGGNRNIVSDIYGGGYVSISGNDNNVQNLQASQIQVGGTRNQIKGFNLSSNYGGTGAYYNLNIEGSRNTIVNGKIKSNGNYYTTGIVIGGERATVQNVSLELCGYAVSLGGTYASINNITIGNCSTGIRLGNWDYGGSSISTYASLTNISMRNTNGLSIYKHIGPATIRNISMVGANGGLSISSSKDLIISNITIVGDNNDMMGCIEMWDSTNNTISNFKIINNYTGSDMPEEWYYSQGISLYNSPKNTFQNGAISNFTNGISIQSSNLIELTNIAVHESRVGVSLSYSNNTRIQSMDNYHNTWSGLEMYTTNNTTIWLSNFINTNNTRLQNAKNTRWYSPNPVQYTYNGITRTGFLGNYWKGYNGTDTDDDGIGDTVQYIDTSSDLYPLVKYWQYYAGKTPSLPPSAGFVADVTEGRDELTVQFTDTSAGIVTSHRWDFGDGVTSTVKNPVHTYNALGYYNVTLTVENEWGSDSLIREGYIHVDTMRPYANFTAVPVSGDAPLTVNFIDTSQYGPEEWYWTFGDGNTSTNRNPTHKYVTSGNYTVSLTASNGYGSTSVSKTDYIRVTEPPLKTTLRFDPAESTINRGEATSYAIVLDKAHYGLAGFNLTISLTDSSIGEIVGVSYPSWASLPVNSSLPADIVTVKAVDLANMVKINATNVTLCTILVRGDGAGTTNLAIVSKNVEDDIAGRYAPDIVNGKLTVRNILPFPNPAGGLFSIPTDPNGDGIYEDLDGNGWIGFNDVVIYYTNLEAIDSGTYGPITLFDYDNNGWAGFNDVVRLYEMIA